MKLSCGAWVQVYEWGVPEGLSLLRTPSNPNLDHSLIQFNKSTSLCHINTGTLGVGIAEINKSPTDSALRQLALFYS